MVPDRDPYALATVLEQLCRDPALARAWGERGQTRIATWSYADTIRAFQLALAA